MSRTLQTTLTEDPRNFDAVGGQVELGVVVALVIVAEAVSVIVVFGGEALLPVVGVGRGEGVFAAGVTPLHRVADEAADALCNCRQDRQVVFMLKASQATSCGSSFL